MFTGGGRLELSPRPSPVMLGLVPCIHAFILASCYDRGERPSARQRPAQKPGALLKNRAR